MPVTMLPQPGPDAGRMKELNRQIREQKRQEASNRRLRLVWVKELEAICPQCGGKREWRYRWCSAKCRRAAFLSRNPLWDRREYDREYQKLRTAVARARRRDAARMMNTGKESKRGR